MAIAAILAAAAMEVRAASLTTAILGVFLVFQAAVYFSAPWASLATEGIKVTPLREIYLRSSQNLADSRATRTPTAKLTVALALVATAGLIVAFATSSPTAPAPSTPRLGPPPAAPAQPPARVRRRHRRRPQPARRPPGRPPQVGLRPQPQP